MEDSASWRKAMALPLRGKARRPALAARGIRPLTRSEYSKLGISPTTRSFTTQIAGVKHLDRSKVLSRRQAEQTILHRTFESYAKRSHAGGHAMPLPGTYTWARLQYRDYQNVRRAAEGLPPLSIGDVRNSVEFKRIYQALHRGKKSADHSRTRKPGGAYARALVELGLRSPHDTHDVGDTPRVK